MTDIGWYITPVAVIDELEPGHDYIVRMVTDDGFWAKGVITVNDKWYDENDEPNLSFRLHTLIDGSPGIMDGFDD